jgi:uncharacterized protein YjlB
LSLLGHAGHLVRLPAATRAFRFADDGETPNNPTLPVVLHRRAASVLSASDPAAVFENLFAAHGWTGSWRNGIYPYLHFHTGVHEVLGVARGRAVAEFGGAKGRLLTVDAGDVAILPAGTGHRCVEASDDLLVVGAYAQGGRFDQVRPGDADRALALASIAATPLPASDPAYGRDGPLVTLWRSEAASMPATRTSARMRPRRDQ